MMVPACNFSFIILSRFRFPTVLCHNSYFQFLLETKQQQQQSTLWHILLVRPGGAIGMQFPSISLLGENRAPVHYLREVSVDSSHF